MPGHGIPKLRNHPPIRNHPLKIFLFSFECFFMGALHSYFENLFKKTYGAIAAHDFFSFKIFLFSLPSSFYCPRFISPLAPLF